MTRKKTCLLSALCTILLLLSCSCARPILCEVCGKPAFNHVCCPAAPCPVCGATYLCDCAVETVVREDPCPVCGATYLCDCAVVILDAAAVQRDVPPTITVSYPYQVNGEMLNAVHSITSGNFDWTVTHDNGTATTTNACGIRPCDNEKAERIPLDRMVDCGYMPEIILEKELIRSYTLKTYRKGNYDFDSGTDCTIQDGKLAVLKGKYYYELTVEYLQGRVIYGFFVE